MTEEIGLFSSYDINGYEYFPKVHEAILNKEIIIVDNENDNYTEKLYMISVFAHKTGIFLHVFYRDKDDNYYYFLDDMYNYGEHDIYEELAYIIEEANKEREKTKKVNSFIHALFRNEVEVISKDKSTINFDYIGYISEVGVDMDTSTDRAFYYDVLFYEDKESGKFLMQYECRYLDDDSVFDKIQNEIEGKKLLVASKADLLNRRLIR